MPNIFVTVVISSGFSIEWLSCSAFTQLPSVVYLYSAIYTIFQ